MNTLGTVAKLSNDQQSRLTGIEELLLSNPAKASAAAAELLIEVPDQPLAKLFLGIAYRLTGEPVAAIEVLKPLACQSESLPMTHLQLGLALREAGQVDAAICALRNAVEIKNAPADAWLTLADALSEIGDREGANHAYNSYALHTDPDRRILNATLALGENRLSDAEKNIRSRLKHYPTDIVALCLLADIAERCGMYQDAEKLLEQCLTFAPSYARARHNYTVILLRQNRIAEALAHCRSLVQDEPGIPDYRKLLAAILVKIRDFDEAILVTQAILDNDPSQAAVWTSLGHMLKSVGRRDRCIEAYRRAISTAPRFGEPYWGLVNLKNFRISDAEMQSMTDALNSTSLDAPNRVHFHFALGRALEQRKAYEDAFENYSVGNRIHRQKNPYDSRELAEHVKSSKSLLTAEFFAERCGWGAGAQDPIFVLGLPRSGSTLVEQILASHSRIEGTTELPSIPAIARSLCANESDGTTTGYVPQLYGLDRNALERLGSAYISETRIQRKTDAPHFVDKLPNNFAHIGLIHLILPNAKIIDVRRHPMACGLSLFKEHFARAQSFSYSLDDIGRYYRMYFELMTHFDQALPGIVHRVVYESLVKNTEAEIRSLLEFCGLPFEESCLNFHQNERSVSTASAEQVRVPINHDGLHQWRHYERWLGPLQEQVGALALSAAQISN